jgi:hypothetical protein
VAGRLERLPDELDDFIGVLHYVTIAIDIFIGHEVTP